MEATEVTVIFGFAVLLILAVVLRRLGLDGYCYRNRRRHTCSPSTNLSALNLLTR